MALTHALANSLGPDVRVNCISPGWIVTSDWQKQATREKPNLSEQDGKQHPAGRVGTPEARSRDGSLFSLRSRYFYYGSQLLLSMAA